MAKNIAQQDLASYSPLVNLFGAVSATALREWGALEYDAALTVNAGATKAITPFDLGANSQLIEYAGTNPTTADMRGAVVVTANREWGALEYDATYVITAATKLVQPFDLAPYSPLINYYRASNNPYRPTRKDLRGIIAPNNAGAGHVATSSLTRVQTTADIRGTTVIGTIREIGTMEYDSTLAIENAFPTVNEIADAVWRKENSTLAGTAYIGRAGANQAAQTLLTGTAQGGAAGNITLSQSAVATNDYYNAQFVVILSGTGAGQARQISDYTGATRVALVSPNWTTTPDTTSIFAVVPFTDGWTVQTATLTGAGSIGKLLVDNIDTTISSRGTADPGDAMNLTAAYNAAMTAAQPGDQMALTAVYNAAMTAAQAGDAMALTPAERQAAATALLDLVNGIENAVTLREAQRLMLSALAGLLSGAATNTIRIRDVNNVRDRIVATVDASGNRTNVILDVT